MTVSCSFGSPAFSPCAFAASRSVNSSAIGCSTMILRADMQICPWWRKAPKAVALTAYSRSASARTITGL